MLHAGLAGDGVVKTDGANWVPASFVETIEEFFKALLGAEDSDGVVRRARSIKLVFQIIKRVCRRVSQGA